MPETPESILGLDVGERLVGVAFASLAAGIARPYITLTRNDKFFDSLQKIIDSENVNTLIVGLPRGLDGQSTAQTASVEDFVKRLRQRFNLTIVFQDEAVTSKQAEAELKSRGKVYQRSDIDSLAATYILEDYLTSIRRI
ncbi:MAG TPA: Holliday junction resolvase RuvX [Candidatus Saccharimonadales bacterium]|nr:Holliday junction resolvase RuvX [Candidatus Saccharimonadales bacterium]